MCIRDSRYAEPGQQLHGPGPSDVLRLDTRRSEEQVGEHPSGDGGFESDGSKPVDIPVLDDGLHPVPEGGQRVRRTLGSRVIVHEHADVDVARESRLGPSRDGEAPDQGPLDMRLVKIPR